MPVTLADIAYHTACVARGNRTALLVADMPFGTCATPQTAFDNAARLMQAGAQMVKIEGGAWLVETVKFLTERAVPVFAHLGLTPQYVHRLGGFKVQLGKEVTDMLAIPTIGIGAGPDCSGQVLVMHDMLGVFPGRKARFVRDFMQGQSSIEGAIRAYITAVKDQSFPAPEHCFEAAITSSAHPLEPSDRLT